MQLSWEFSVIVGLAVLFMAFYAFGSIWNKKIQRSFWRALREELKRYSRRVSYKSFGSSGFKVGFKLPSGPLTKVEISLVLLAREMPLYFLAAYATGRRDRMLVKANVAGKPDFYLEALSKWTRLSREVKLKAGEFKPVKIGGLAKYMKVLTTNPEKAREILSGRVFDYLMALKDCLERFSISKAPPHVMIVCRRDESKIGEALGLLESAAEALVGPAGEEGRGTTRGRRGRR